MRFAVVSDIHANLPAWQTVLADLTALKAEMVICLGDVVGYGPQPAETLSSVHAHVDYLVLGNHDAALCGLLPIDAFNDDAAAMIRWTGEQVDATAVEFLKTQPLTLLGDDFICVHGTAHEPGTFGYVYDEEDARACLDATDVPLVFVGHTHYDGIHYLNRENEYRTVDPVDFVMEDGKRYVVNPGSVGMARGDDFRATYCIYDSADRSITFRKVAYDVNVLKAVATERAADCSQLNYVLALFDENRRSPVREHVDFSPVKTPHGDFVMNQEIQTRGRAWRWAFVLAMLLAVTLGSTSWAMWAHRTLPNPPPKTLCVDARNPAPLPLDMVGDNYVELIRKDNSGEPNGALINLSFSLSHPVDSHVHKTTSERVRLSNQSTAGEIYLQSPPLTLGDYSKIQAFILFDADTDALPSLYVDQIMTDDTVVQGVDFKNAVAVKTGGYRIQRTPKAFGNAVKAIILRLHWTGTGTVTIKRFAVRPR